MGSDLHHMVCHRPCWCDLHGSDERDFPDECKAYRAAVLALHDEVVMRLAKKRALRIDAEERARRAKVAPQHVAKALFGWWLV